MRSRTSRTSWRTALACILELAQRRRMPTRRKRIAVIGAGMAGLSCARLLHAGDFDVMLFDKGRRPGGRLASRRIEGLRFDHGAQYATARGAAFQAFLAGAGERVAAWNPDSARPRWVGLPGMSALAEAAARSGVGTLLPLRQVTFIERASAGWLVHHQDARAVRPGTIGRSGEPAGPFDRVVLALPAPQAAPLLAASGHEFAVPVAAVVMDPCWAVMLAYVERQPGADMRTLDGPLCWIARDSSRPGRPGSPDCWVAHGSAAWSAARLEREPDAVLADLHAAFSVATGIEAAPIHRAAHRWRYARTQRPLGQACLSDPAAGLVVCGDWCLGGRVEAAFDSGRAAAAAA